MVGFRLIGHTLCWLALFVAAWPLPASAWVEGSPVSFWLQGGMNWVYDGRGAPAAVAAGAEAAVTRAANTWNRNDNSSFRFSPPATAVTNPTQPAAPPPAARHPVNDCLNAWEVPSIFPDASLPDPWPPGATHVNKPDGKNTIGWASSTDPDLLALTRVRVAEVGDPLIRQTVEVDICLNVNTSWSAGPGAPGLDQYDLETIVLHELGHALGLLHPNQYGNQRTGDDYQKVVMFSHFPPGGPDFQALQTKRRLRCDDKAGAAFKYSPAGVPTEARDHNRPNAGGCDFGDAPAEPLGEYPSWEKGRPIDTADDLPARAGARHKDCTMEWLGPISEVNGTVRNIVPPPGAADLRELQAAKAAAADPQDLRCGHYRGPGNRSGVTFEPETRSTVRRNGGNWVVGYDQLVNQDELDNGVLIVPHPTIPGSFLVDILVLSFPVAGRYAADAAIANRHLFLNGWEDWDGDGVWDTPAGLGCPTAGKPGDAGAPGSEYVLCWEGTPAVDVAASPNFAGGVAVAVGPFLGRLLTFVVTPPSAAALSRFARFRLDYAENAGANAQTWTDHDDVSGEVDLLRERGTAAYGEVEDYRTAEPLNSTGTAQFTLRQNRPKVADDQLVEVATFRIPAGQEIDPLAEVVTIELSEPGCGGRFLRLSIPPGAFAARGTLGTIAFFKGVVVDEVTGARVEATVRITREGPEQFRLALDLKKANFICLEGVGTRKVTTTLVVGDDALGGEQCFGRTGDGDLVFPLKGASCP